MQIRRGEMRDLDALAALYDEVTGFLEAHVNYPGWKMGVYPTREDAASALQDGALFVAEANGQIAGALTLRSEPVPGYERAAWRYDLAYEQIFVLHTLAVRPACARQGVASALLRFAERHAGETGVRALRLDVYAKNAPAIALYERTGFQYVDTVQLCYEGFGLGTFRLYEKLL